MRVAAMAALLLGTSWAASFHPTRTPSEIKLKWLPDEEHGGVELPHMEITFADGTTDEIFLNVDPENPCFYHGGLKSDIESEVEVDGCKDELETVEISSRLIPCGLVFLLLEEGKTYETDPRAGVNFNSTESDVEYPTGPTSVPGVASKGRLPSSAVARGGSRCRCNGATVRSGWYKPGLGSCGGGGYTISCGNFCFVNKGECWDQVYLNAFGYYASCKPCSQSKTAPPLKTAECPRAR